MHTTNVNNARAARLAATRLPTADAIACGDSAKEKRRHVQGPSAHHRGVAPFPVRFKTLPERKGGERRCTPQWNRGSERRTGRRLCQHCRSRSITDSGSPLKTPRVVLPRSTIADGETPRRTQWPLPDLLVWTPSSNCKLQCVSSCTYAWKIFWCYIYKKRIYKSVSENKTCPLLFSGDKRFTSPRQRKITFERIRR